MKYKLPLYPLLLAVPLTASAANTEAHSDTSRVETAGTLCESGETQSSKYIASADAYILSYNCNCTAQENHILIILGQPPKAYQLDASNTVSTLELEGLDAIPDTFSRVPLCEKTQAAGSAITILNKIPSTSGAAPYCYSGGPFIEQNNTQCLKSKCKSALKLLNRTSKPSHTDNHRCEASGESRVSDKQQCIRSQST